MCIIRIENKAKLLVLVRKKLDGKRENRGGRKMNTNSCVREMYICISLFLFFFSFSFSPCLSSAAVGRSQKCWCNEWLLQKLVWKFTWTRFSFVCLVIDIYIQLAYELKWNCVIHTKTTSNLSEIYFEHKWPTPFIWKLCWIWHFHLKSVQHRRCEEIFIQNRTNLYFKTINIIRF